MRATRGRRAAGAKRRAALIAVVSVLALVGLPLSLVAPAAAADPPVVDAVFDSFGPAAGGASVTIMGHGFTGATGVRFGVGTPATSFVVIDDASILAVSPPAPTPPDPITLVQVFVDGPGGTSAAGESSSYRYLAPPRITAATPTTSSFEGGQVVDVTITGMQPFDVVRNVLVDGASGAGFTYTDIADPMVLRVFTPPHAAGVAHLAVESSGGTSDAIDLTYLDVPLPRIDSFAPALGPIAGGTTVSIVGSGFTGAIGVDFDDVAAASFEEVDDGHLTVVTPAVSSTRFTSITVRTVAGASPAAPSSFLFQGAPQVTGLTPASGPPAGGTNVVIDGVSFVGVTAVRFGDEPATWSLSDDSTIHAVSPPHADGVVPVVVENALGSSPPAFFDYTTAAPPTIERVTPNRGGPLGGYPVVVRGGGFRTARSVLFRSPVVQYEAAFTIDSDAQLTVTAPNVGWPGVYDVFVTNAYGTNAASLADWFLVESPAYVASVDPSGGPTAGGRDVTIAGGPFDGTTQVRFGDVPAASFTVISRDLLSAVTPPHAVGKVAVSVTTPTGTSSTVPGPRNTYEYVPDGVPVVTGKDPGSGLEAGGDAVMIAAIDADFTTGVRFGDVPATSFEVLGPYVVRAVAPPHAVGDVDLVLESATGESAPNAATRFTFLPTPPPYVDGLSPRYGPIAGGTSVTISGSGFVHVGSVTFGGVPATFTVDSPNRITAVAPPSTATDDETVDVVVTTSLGASPMVSQDVFTYQAVHALEITSTAPDRGSIQGGTHVTMYGRGFTNATAVYVGDGIPVTSFAVTGDFQLDVDMPAVPEPYLYNITVVTPQGTTTPTGSSWFLYLGPPQVWGMSHYQGLTGGGEEVTITGDQLLGAHAVLFGDRWAAFRIVDNHTIVATVPPCAAGMVVVRVYGGDGYSETTLGSLYTYRTPGTPTVTSVTANRGSVAGGETVVIAGSGFTGATSVRFGRGGLATSFHVDSDTQITAVAPARPDGALVNVFVDDTVGSSESGPASWYLYE